MSSLLDPLQLTTKTDIVKHFWGSASNSLASEAYWTFFIEECRQALDDGGSHNLARTHQDLIDTVGSLKSGHLRHETQGILRKKLTKIHDNELQLIDNTIYLTASLLLMIDFGQIEYGFSGRRKLEWTSGTLQACVSLGFDRTPSLDHKGIKLERAFNAQSLSRFAGLEIVPTTNLLDHLRLTHDDTRLHIFHHASFLNHQLQDSLLPDGLAQETLRTLALLFPKPENRRAQKWSRQLAEPFSLDQELWQCGYLTTDDRQLENFAYWHDRLVVLKQVFDESSPKTISQWWYDRRNSVQWWTFWIAVMVLIWTLVTGLIQSIASIMQVYAAFNTSPGA